MRSLTRRRAASLVALVAALAALGCPTSGPEAAPLRATAPFESGRRLRAIYLDVPGLRIWHSFFDTALGLKCRFGSPRGPDHARYCLPPAVSSDFWHADPSCTDEALADSASFSCGRSGLHIFEEPTDSCASRGRLFEIGEAVPLSSPIYTESTTDGVKHCSVHDAVGRPLFRRGRERPLSSFVSAREMVVETGGRLDVLTLEAADGARLRVGGWDGRRGEPVEPTGSLAGFSAWVPQRSAYLAALFADDACTQEVATKYARGAACPLTAALDVSTSFKSFYEIGERVEGAVYARDEKGRCAQTARASESQNYRVGVARPFATFEPSQVVEVGEGRLRARYLAGSDKTPITLIANVYRDTLRDEDCAFFDTDSDSAELGGISRCLPAARAARARISCDSALSPSCEPDVEVYVPRGETPPKEVTYETLSDHEPCSSPAPIVYRVGAYKESVGTLDYYYVGAVVSLTNFVAAALRME